MIWRMMKVERPRIKIDKGIWICEDIEGNTGKGRTPREAWYEYKIKIVDKIMELVYNNETFS
jgi:hypothetical protein